ncbi:metallophosphoesterase family protein [Floridanema evergladense]|uniref:Metallophosphoesterase n=1 Tax=Floridaenema evergladense BLCC-F167 TaxID=3153639 RepID=A0ABV4WGR9_9CYAN
MNFNRRQFLVLGGLTGLGLGFLTKFLPNTPAESTDTQSKSQLSKVVPKLVTPKEPPPFRFVSVADTGTGTKSQYAVAEAMSRYYKKNPYDLVILAGDNIYNNGEMEKIKAVFERPYEYLLKKGVKFRACLGNHDIRTENGDPQVRYAGFNMPSRYYTFRHDYVQFFALDTNVNADWKNQLSWLEKELSLSDAPWKIVFGHHQIYSSGVYGLNQPFIKTFTPLFQKYKVQLYINGHEHSYERTRSIDGTTYMITGGGAGTRPVGSSDFTEYSASRLSFAAYEVYRDRILISAIGTDHLVFDKGVIKL